MATTPGDRHREGCLPIALPAARPGGTVFVSDTDLNRGAARHRHAPAVATDPLAPRAASPVTAVRAGPRPAHSCAGIGERDTTVAAAMLDRLLHRSVVRPSTATATGFATTTPAPTLSAAPPPAAGDR